jgi:orotate phosphoribosyltransferase
MSDNKDLTDLLIQSKAIEFGNFTLSSGEQSNYYVDMKTFMTDPDMLSLITSRIIKRLSYATCGCDFDVVAGVAVGGIPLAVCLSMVIRKPYAIIRTGGKKMHGRKDVVIGDVKYKNVLLVEDVTTSGKSAFYGVDELRKKGAFINNVITVVDREEGAEELLSDNGIALYSLIKMSDINRNA